MAEIAPPLPSYSSARRWSLIAAGLVGILVWYLWFGDHVDIFLTVGLFGPAGFLLLAMLVIAIAFVPIARNLVLRFVEFLRELGERRKITTTFVIAIFATIYLIGTGVQQHRVTFPVVHDEFSYLIGAHQLATGRLWMHAHPLAKFFDSFQLIVDPVYTSAYFPGTALLFAVAILAHVPAWIGASVLSGLAVALVYLVIVELLDAAAGVQAVLLLLATGLFRTLSFMVMAQVPVMLGGLVTILSWIYWRKTKKTRWLILLGISSSFAVITRPVDAICFVLPIAIALLTEWKTNRLVRIVPIILLSASPLLFLQLLSNRGITGHLLQTPFQYYADRDHPLTNFGFHKFDPSATPVSDLPQKRDLYFNDYRPQIIAHTLPTKCFRNGGETNSRKH